MTPFRGVKGRAQSSYNKQARNSERNSHYAQAGRGRRTRAGLKSNFTSSRVDDQTQDHAEQHCDETSKLDEEFISGSDGVSNDDDDDTAATAVKPYSVLLQSLHETPQRGQPSRKKQKQNDFEVIENINTGEKDLDLVLEPEEVGNSVVEELIDEDGDDEKHEGMS